MHRDWCGTPDCPNPGEDGELMGGCEDCDMCDIDPIEELYEYSKEHEWEEVFWY